MNEPVVTYEPDNSIKKGFIALFIEIYKELTGNRWLIYQLFKRDFLTIYKQSFIGIFWAFIIPFVSLGTFIILNKSGIFSIGTMHVPYPIYAILGLAFWQLFSTGIVAGANSLVKAGTMIIKINFSKKSLVFASIGQSLVAFLVQIVLLGIIFATYHFTPQATVFLLPLFMIPIILLTLGLGFVISLLNGVFRDIGNTLSILIAFLMFLTPVLYAKPESGILTTITKYNPLYYLISVPRDLILIGTVTEWRGYVLSSVLSLVVFLVCLVMFHLTETRVAERI